ncbi:hypothetical protein NQ314_004324 [Rhamnusium bicolor]|uniref:Nose resistant-to-fluoxetine protein N-terminal domain-containing protein n=1 Tax=Rhamnusium bicolor TaxID=1586634 RepID=A0AAV8ZK99_9CUCU|nr:hypothetical protein NQ314_004324 [Rhamnusium bicolor]
MGAENSLIISVYDSTAKLPSGILNGNVNQFGDFDKCIAINSKSRNIFGQYCLTSMEVQTPSSSYLAGLHKLIQSHYHFKSKLEDVSAVFFYFLHRQSVSLYPDDFGINWALCVPDACTPNDVELGLKKTVDDIFKGTEIKVRYEVDSAMCQTSKNTRLPVSTYIGISFFVTVILVELIATAYDYLACEKKCLTHTHHIGIDTQLFFASPFLILMLWSWPKRGALILLLLASISTIMRFYVTYTMRLSNYVHFGTS